MQLDVAAHSGPTLCLQIGLPSAWLEALQVSCVLLDCQEQGQMPTAIRPAGRTASLMESPGKRARTAATAGSNVLVWLRQDLRLHDQPAVCAAAEAAQRSSSQLHFIFVFSADEDGEGMHEGGLHSFCKKVQ